MKKSVSALAKEGVSAKDGINAYFDAIKNAGDATEATSIATEIFGTKAASTMASAIRDGTLSVDDLTASLEANSESINGAATDTYDFAEYMQLMMADIEWLLETFEPRADLDDIDVEDLAIQMGDVNLTATIETTN